MRLIGSINDKQQLERFVSYLITQHISVFVEQDQKQWQVWIRDEDQVTRASELLDEFKREPHQAKYSQAVDQATGILNEKARRQASARKRIRTAAEIRPAARFRSPLTITLIGISVFVWLVTGLGNLNNPNLRPLLFTAIDARTSPQLVLNGNRDGASMKLQNIAHGQVWRLITPAFVHFGAAHLIFNMFALIALGRPIEDRYGTLYYAILIIVLAVASNFLQAVVPARLGGIPLPPELRGGWLLMPFGGMSGVIYGLFGFAWMKSEFDPSFGYVVPFSVVIWAIAWFYLGVSNLDSTLLGFQMANWAHGTGLVGGILIGLATIHRGVRRTPAGKGG